MSTDKVTKTDGNLPIFSVVCSTRNTPAYALDNIKFHIDKDEFLIFMIAHKGIHTDGQIFYNGEAGYVIIKNGKTMMTADFDETLVNTLLRWNLIPRR